jgi:hypothetical protein
MKWPEAINEKNDCPMNSASINRRDRAIGDGQEQTKLLTPVEAREGTARTS